MKLRSRITRALFSTLPSVSSLRNASSSLRSTFSRMFPVAGLGFTCVLAFGVVGGVHAEDRYPAAVLALPPGTATPGSSPLVPLHPATQPYELHLHHLHTGETIDVVYRVGDRYIPSAVAQLNHFLRDHRTQDVSHYDPREFDLLHNVLVRLGRQNSVIDVVCGYRTPWSNSFLRARSASTGVAQHSQHMLAKAIDIRVPGVTTTRLRDAAMSLGAGGVGYYPISQFVHVDVGPVRHWSFGGRGE